ELSVCIYGAAYTSEVYDERILDGFRVGDENLINIVILHSNLHTEGYSPVTASEIAASGADYIALAHVHMPTEILKSGKTSYAYCGCLEPRDFGECYDAGFYIGEITKEKIELSRRKISDVSYKKLTVNIEEFPDVVSALPFPRGREHLRLTLVGECEKPDICALKAKLSPSYEELEIFDKTTSPRDIWQGLGEDSLRGVFLRKMKEKIESCNDAEEKEKLELAARFGIDAIENRDM
ncbi:MAG: hypothetical protein IKU65_01690, partial [Oscillospiraceae bacterium]|nr:hypothetical protein [Oscillospiraceae bacterium]